MKLFFLLLGYVIIISQYRHTYIDYRIKQNIHYIQESVLRADGKLCRQLIAYQHYNIIYN